MVKVNNIGFCNYQCLITDKGSASIVIENVLHIFNVNNYNFFVVHDFDIILK